MFATTNVRTVPRVLLWASLSLAVLSGSTIANAQHSATKDSAMTAEQIVAKHVQALGGPETLKNVETLRITGTFNFNGIDTPMVIERKRPDFYRSEITTERGQVIVAHGSEGAWSLGRSRDPKELSTLDAEATARLLEEAADFDGPLVHFAEKGHSATFVGEEDIDGIPTYHLHLKLKSGNNQEWFLSQEDFTVVKKVIPQTHPRRGEYQRQWYLMEYQEVEGLRLPFYLEQEDRQHVRAHTIEKVEINPKLDPAVFSPPGE